MKLEISTWTVSRKKIRPSFNLGALGMLFSISDRVSGPKLSDQDRLDTVFPYRLEVAAVGVAAGRYHLNPADTDVHARAWAEGLGGRVWRTEKGKSGSGAAKNRLVTDLTEYERVLWEELAAGTEHPTLRFEALE